MTMCCPFSISALLFLLLISLLSLPSVCISNMLTSESQTLFKIMESMSSDQTWRTSYPNPCQPGSSWPGLECKIGKDNLFHVSRLDFGNPPSPICKNTSTFPSLIFSLPYLQSVFFFNCFIHPRTNTFLTFPPTSVPISASSLQQLSLRSNPSLIGPIPPQISSLKCLQVLTLTQNGLNGTIPIEIFNFNSLLHLDLSYNMLTGNIPFQLGNLKNLVGLDFSYNLLTRSIPTTISQMGLLQKLDLSSNLLTGRIPDGIENLKFLVFLDLSNNKLSGDFPKGFVKLQSLQYLIMDDNQMNTSLPLEFGELLKLQELRLANSGYSGSIPPIFAKLMNLTTLSLQSNRLTGEIPAGFGDLSHIYHLNLSRNLLSGVVPFNSSFLRRLGMNLDLSGNPNLCMNPSEAFGVKIGVDVCESNNSRSNILPLQKSRASFGHSKPFVLLSSLGVLGFHQIFFSQ